ncbi:hypothetical protein AgCh_005703 [Apium graveolens]
MRFQDTALEDFISFITTCHRLSQEETPFGHVPSGHVHVGHTIIEQFSVPFGHISAGFTPPIIHAAPFSVLTPVVQTHVPSITHAVPAAPDMPTVPTTHAEKPKKFNGMNFKRWQQKMHFYLTTLYLDRFLKEESDAATSTIEGEGTVILKMISGKNLTLKNVLYVPDIRKNLVFYSLLNKHGFRIIIESNKAVLSKSGMFVGKGYVTDELFKLNVMSIKDDNEMKNSSAYLLESPNLWHGMVHQQAINPNAQIVVSDGGQTPVGHVPSGYVLVGYTVIGQFSVPLGQISAGFTPPIIHAVPTGVHTPVVQTHVPSITHAMPDAPVMPTVPTAHAEKPEKFNGMNFKHRSQQLRPYGSHLTINAVTSTIEGEGTVILKMTSGKNLTLKNVLYVPDICKNLVFGSLLNKHGFRIVIESDKAILSKSGMFVGKGYVTDGLFKLNVMSIKDDNEMKNSFAYLLESPNLWHAMLISRGFTPPIIYAVPTGVHTPVVQTHVPSITHTVPAAPVMPTVPTAHAEKPEKFNGMNFKHWQQKMQLHLTMLHLDRFLKEEVPLLTGESNSQTMYVVDAWKHSDYICRNYVLNCLADSLYNVYSSKPTTKALWESLDHMYKTEDTGAKKWIFDHFLDYKMTNSKTVVSQIHRLLPLKVKA